MPLFDKQFSRVFKVSPRQKKWIITILICVVALVLMASALPAFSIYLWTLKRQAKTEKSKLKLETQKIQTLVSRKESFKDAQSLLERQREMYFTDFGARLFLKQLNRVADEIGGRIILIKPLKEEPVSNSEPDTSFADKYKNAYIQVDFEGDFTTLLDFLEALKVNKHLIGVDEIKIDSSAQNDLLKVRMVLVLYEYQSPEGYR